MIITDEKILREKSLEIPDYPEGYRHLIQDLERALEESPRPGLGLSAIQIGVPLRVAIVRTSDLKLDLYNAKIVSALGMYHFKDEGCLSIPDTYVTTQRMRKIVVQNGDGKLYPLEGLNAAVVQHELNHWDGILITDIAIKNTGGI